MARTEQVAVQAALADSRAYLEKKAKDGTAVLLPSLAVADLLVTLRRAEEALS